MNTLTYFVTVFPTGLAFLGFRFWRDSKIVPTGQNFLPTASEMKDFIGG